MGNSLSFGFEDESLKTWLDDDIAVIELKSCVYGAITDLAESGRLLSFFHTAETDSRVSVLFLTSSSACFSADKFAAFYEQIKPKPNGDAVTGSDIELRSKRLRYSHVLNRVVGQLADFRKISAISLIGNVVTPFFGASLAADIRFVTEDMVYDPAHVRLGAHAGGGLPFFLPLYIGYGRASDILYRGLSLDAQALLELGLITDILPRDGFLDLCITRLKAFSSSMDKRTLLSTKMLLADARSGLSRFFEREAALIV